MVIKVGAEEYVCGRAANSKINVVIDAATNWVHTFKRNRNARGSTESDAEMQARVAERVAELRKAGPQVRYSLRTRSS